LSESLTDLRDVSSMQTKTWDWWHCQKKCICVSCTGDYPKV